MSPLLGTNSVDVGNFSFVGPVAGPIVDTVRDPLSGFNDVANNLLVVTLNVIVLIITVALVNGLVGDLVINHTGRLLGDTVNHNPLCNVTSNATMAMLIRSSSAAADLVIPLMNANILGVQSMCPFALNTGVNAYIATLLTTATISNRCTVFTLRVTLIRLYFGIVTALIVFNAPFLHRLPLGNTR